MDLPGRPSLTARLVAAVAATSFATSCSPGPVSVSAPTAEAAAGPLCARLHARLPAQLGGLARRRTEPPSDRTAAWGRPAIALRCGVSGPPDFQPQLTPVAEVNGISWYQTLAGSTVQWICVDRPVHVELDIPTAYAGQGGFLADLAGAISATLPKTAEH